MKPWLNVQLDMKIKPPYDFKLINLNNWFLIYFLLFNIIWYIKNILVFLIQKVIPEGDWRGAPSHITWDIRMFHLLRNKIQFGPLAQSMNLCLKLQSNSCKKGKIKPNLYDTAQIQVKTRDEDPVMAKNRIRGPVPQTKGDF